MAGERSQQYLRLKRTIAETLQSGYALTTKDLAGFLEQHGFSSKSAGSDLITEMKTGHFRELRVCNLL